MEFILKGLKFGTSLISGLPEEQAMSDTASSPTLQIDGDELDALMINNKKLTNK